MKRIVIASTNPVKVRAVECGFARMFPGETCQFITVAVLSGVAEQPFGSDEALQGARNRVSQARLVKPDADFWIGVEGGVEEHDGRDHDKEMAAFAWIVVESSMFQGKGRTGTFFLPPAVAELVRKGKELGEADDIIFGKSNSKQENGAVGILTGDVIDRASLYEQAVILALIPHKTPQLFSPIK
jgi:inosine/xanthosine triphosphatase